MRRYLIDTAGTRSELPPQLSHLREQFFDEAWAYCRHALSSPPGFIINILNDISEFERRIISPQRNGSWFLTRIALTRARLSREPIFVEGQWKSHGKNHVIRLDCHSEGTYPYENVHEALARIHETISANQYSISSNNIRGKIVIDAGANTGVFSITAALLGAKRVYAFEPVSSSFNLLKRNIRENKVGHIVIPINAGLWNAQGHTTIEYRFPGDSCANLSSKSILHPGFHNKSERIRLVSVDAFLKNKPCDFIKIDAEGCEEEILQGAKRTIKLSKPVLSFSAYHFAKDKTRLPALVKHLRPDYTIRLNHFEEPVFYCE